MTCNKCGLQTPRRARLPWRHLTVATNDPAWAGSRSESVHRPRRILAVPEHRPLLSSASLSAARGLLNIPYLNLQCIQLSINLGNSVLVVETCFCSFKVQPQSGKIVSNCEHACEICSCEGCNSSDHGNTQGYPQRPHLCLVNLLFRDFLGPSFDVNEISRESTQELFRDGRLTNVSWSNSHASKIGGDRLRFGLARFENENAHNASTLLEMERRVRHVDDGTMQGAIIARINVARVRHQHAIQRIVGGWESDCGLSRTEMYRLACSNHCCMTLLQFVYTQRVITTTQVLGFGARQEDIADGQCQRSWSDL